MSVEEKIKSGVYNVDNNVSGDYVNKMLRFKLDLEQECFSGHYPNANQIFSFVWDGYHCNGLNAVYSEYKKSIEQMKLLNK